LPDSDFSLNAESILPFSKAKTLARYFMALALMLGLDFRDTEDIIVTTDIRTQQHHLSHRVLTALSRTKQKALDQRAVGENLILDNN